MIIAPSCSGPMLNRTAAVGGLRLAVYGHPHRASCCDIFVTPRGGAVYLHNAAGIASSRRAATTVLKAAVNTGILLKWVFAKKTHQSYCKQ
jgi:hypothetical protein